LFILTLVWLIVRSIYTVQQFLKVGKRLADGLTFKSLKIGWSGLILKTLLPLMNFEVSPSFSAFMLVDKPYLANSRTHGEEHKLFDI